MQSILCNHGLAILQQRLLPLTTSLTVTPSISHPSAAGCLISMQIDTRGSSTFLWRFGVLLAADTGAHNLLPDLPMAPKAEIAAASA